MRKVLIAISAIVSSLVAATVWWRRHPRVGSAYMNRAVNPWLVQNGLIEESGREIGLLEHVGRRSGTVRLSPIHPVATPNGFRIVVPLGLKSQWAQNVLAAGHCRVQVGEIVHELDEPVLVEPSQIGDVPPLVAQVMTWLGFRYLLLHRFAAHPGELAEPAEPIEAPAESALIEPAMTGTMA
jgi:deazaflavin-dependent oxidoreductase (nitroreductase family)